MKIKIWLFGVFLLVVGCGQEECVVCQGDEAPCDVSCMHPDCLAVDTADALNRIDSFQEMETVDLEEDETHCLPGQGCVGEISLDEDLCYYGVATLHEGNRVCTRLCEFPEDCPTPFYCDYSALFDAICRSPRATLCMPCNHSTDCEFEGESHGARCVNYGSDMGGFCGAGCVEDWECPLGYGCEASVTAEGQVVPQCLPKSGACSCTGWSKLNRLTTQCLKKNAFGECPGERECAPYGVSDCNAKWPTKELCDGEDNNCNGVVDEETCPNDNACMSSVCMGPGGCVVTVLDGVFCDDSDPCTAGDVCHQNECKGEPLVCDDGDPCTVDVCFYPDGCQFIEIPDCPTESSGR